MNSRYHERISAARSSGHSVGPATTVESGLSRNANRVTTPKLPPPPRSAQRRSGCRSSFAVTKLPSARTTSASIRLSIESPSLRVMCPTPPPSVSPPTPVVEMIPNGAASPNGCVAWSTSPSSVPPSTCATRALGSTTTPRRAERSITSPSSTLPSPGPLCAPQRTATSSPASRATLTAAITSAASTH